MYIFPLITRELSVAQRRRSTFRLRMGFGVGTMAFTAWAFLVWQGDTASAGHALFGILAWIALGGSLVTATLLASDSLSREKREGTLGFLFLTDLQAAEIVVGKLAAAAVVPIFTLMAMFPSFAVCQLLGSVTPGEFWRVMFALLVGLAASLSLTIWISSCCTSRRVAIGASAFALVFLNPGWNVLLAFDGAYQLHRMLFWLILLIEISFSIALLQWASSKVSASWRDKEFGLARTEGDQEKSLLSVPKVLKRRFHFGQLQPVQWLILRTEKPAASLWLVALGLEILLITTLVGQIRIGRPGALWSLTIRPPILTFVSWLGLFVVFHFLAKLLVLGRASHQLFADRQDGNLELLLATPLETAELFEGFKNALRRRVLGPVLFIIALDFVSAVLFFQEGPAGLISAVSGALLWPEILVIIWVGVYRILLGNHLATGLITASIRALVIPAISGALALLVFRNGDPLELAFIWMIGNLAAALYFFSEARSALLKHGRTLLLRPYGTKPPVIESDWSAMNWEEENTWQGDIKSDPAAGESGNWSPFNWEEERKAARSGS
jgi:hypothetical protein